jgi:hypothetical protein
MLSRPRFQRATHPPPQLPCVLRTAVRPSMMLIILLLLMDDQSEFSRIQLPGTLPGEPNDYILQIARELAEFERVNEGREDVRPVAAPALRRFEAGKSSCRYTPTRCSTAWRGSRPSRASSWSVRACCRWSNTGTTAIQYVLGGRGVARPRSAHGRLVRSAGAAGGNAGSRSDRRVGRTAGAFVDRAV